jgi:hypothetical protein
MKLVASLLLALLTVLPTFAQQSTREDFKEYCQIVSGRWVGENPLEADWPGIGKRGEKITIYSENKLAEDGHVLVGRFFQGTGSGTEVLVYDAAAKQIRASGGDSGGTTWLFVLYKKDGKWTSQGANTLADGTKYEGLYTLNVSDNGSTHRWTGSTKVPGRAPDAVNNVYRRVSK